jgi:hypothetical protein
MKCWAALILALGTGCVVHDKVPIQTQVRTFPEGALVEFNGLPVGRAPAAVTLPQDTNGRLVERSVLRAIPNSEQKTLMVQSRILEPGERNERVPDYVMLDMTLPSTNSPASTLSPGSTVESGRGAGHSLRPKPLDRGKPTQPVGIDRWNPGIY